MGKVNEPRSLHRWAIEFQPSGVLTGITYGTEEEAIKVAEKSKCAVPIPVVILTEADWRRLVGKNKKGAKK